MESVTILSVKRTHTRSILECTLLENRGSYSTFLYCTFVLFQATGPLIPFIPHNFVPRSIRVTQGASVDLSRDYFESNTHQPCWNVNQTIDLSHRVDCNSQTVLAEGSRKPSAIFIVSRGRKNSFVGCRLVHQTSRSNGPIDDQKRVRLCNEVSPGDKRSSGIKYDWAHDKTLRITDSFVR